MCGADDSCMCAFELVPKNTASAPTGTSAISNKNCVGRSAATINALPSIAAAMITSLRVDRPRCAATRPPITVPTPKIAMRKPASPAPPSNVSLAISVKNVGKL